MKLPPAPRPIIDGTEPFREEASPAQPRMGRPPVDERARKKNRAISLTDAEYEELQRQAFAHMPPIGVSAYVIKMLRLNK